MPPTWRAMTPADLPQVEAVADIVHPAYPEDAAVLAERLDLFPTGCHVLAGPDRLHGYAISHPWHDQRPPKLNHKLHALPDFASCAYIHDLALLDSVRGIGAGYTIARNMIAAAGNLPVCLVAVENSIPFWTRLGFQSAGDTQTQILLQTYGPSATYMRRT